MKKIYTTQSGRSMIEMLGVLAVIGVLTVGGFSLVSKVTTAHKSNVTIDEIGTLANKARAVFREYVLDKNDAQNSEDLEANLVDMNFNKYIIDNKIFPPSLEVEEGILTSRNDIQYEFKDIKGGQDVDYFYIKISRLDNEMCMTIAQATWGSPSLNGYIGICVGSDCGDTGGVVGNTDPGLNVAKNGAKVSLEGATEACNAGAENVVYLTFR